MRRLILDSSYVIDFLRDGDHATEFYDSLGSPKLELSSLVKLEVKRCSRDIGRFDELDTVNFTGEDVEEALDMISFLENRGKMINKLDILIAAQASASQLRLITTDKDFEKLDDFDGFEYEIVGKDE